MRYLTFGASRFTSGVAVLSALVLPGYIHARHPLTPPINRARDAQLAGDSQAGTRFPRLHRLSILINGLQWSGVLAAPVLVMS